MLWPLFVILTELALKATMIVYIIMRRRTTPASNIAWITVILVIPLLGVIAYLFIGENRLGSRRTRRHKAIVDRLNQHWATLRTQSAGDPRALNAIERSIALLAESVAGSPPTGGNDLILYSDTDETMDALIRDVDNATDHCHFMVYIMLDDSTGRRVSDALIRAAERGVTCRLLLDSVGSRDFLASDTCANLKRKNVAVVEMLRVSIIRMLFARLDIRNHRKIFIVDGNIGYMGSQNVADADFAPKPKFAPWYDTMVRIEGPAVLDLQALFVTDWFYDTNTFLDEVLQHPPSPQDASITAQILGTGPHAHPDAMRHVLHCAIHSAREEVIITTPYFVPDEGTVLALCAAAHREVRTILILPKRNDSPLVAAASRGTYERLLEAGVEIREFRPGLLHSKTLTIDRAVGLIGSANLDQRSFSINFEVNMFVYDSDIASQLRMLQMSYVNESDNIELEAWLKRSWFRKFTQQAAGTLGPLL